MGWCSFRQGEPFPPEALAALENDPNAVLYSIDPWPEEDADESVGLRGHKIMGQMVLSSAEDRKFFARALDRATRGAFEGAACFDPRHAFRATGPAGTYEFFVCFACGRTRVRMPDGNWLPFVISGDSKVFNRFLKEHNIPLAER
ncbi:hypothetical protein AYO49_01540 [Verrucomicrobiaceae bacterium SCGC AG-212-N21]|nr:hypothetical protein AYO49_01540 [Verrucomicrobiaceae bacterium SCGC AG-212-N21]